ncbi:response regulator transcription factor [Pseudolysinimonas sp.]|uniref:response regulator transcription factor n=1 Tax=Pseudolysinimonas sp. TaxID=2680009 RepID=UPI003F7FD350
MPTATEAELDGSARAHAPRVRVAILDDHEVLLDSLGSWIQAHAPEFEVAVLATSWLSLVHDPGFPTDLVLLDFQLREPVSIEARVRTCRAAGAKVIVLSGVETPEARDRALAAGAEEFVSKALSMREVMGIAREVTGVDRADGMVHQRSPHAILTRPKLSPAEREALLLYVSGLSTGEVGARMGVQFETAKTYLRRVREKYARAGRPASKKAELARRAVEDGLHS